MGKQLGQLQACAEVADKRSGANLERFQGSVLPGKGHAGLRVKRGRGDCCGKVPAIDNGAREAKKILARLGACAGQPGQDFL